MKFYPFEIPQKVTNNIRSVDILSAKVNPYYKTVKTNNQDDLIVVGFIFFDAQRKIIWQIGKKVSKWSKKATVEFSNTVHIGKDEQIVGVVAKLHPKLPSVYTDF